MKKSFFGCALLVCSIGAAEPERTPVSAREIDAGIWLMGENFTLSEDGRWLTFPSNRGEAYVDLSVGRMFNQKEGWATVSYGDGERSAWAPGKNAMALFARREGRMALTVWTPDTGQSRELLVLPRRLGFGQPPVWSPDARQLFVIVNQDLPWEKSDPAEDHPPEVNNNVSLGLSGHYRRNVSRQRFVREYPQAYAENARSLVIAVDVESGRTRLLLKGNDIQSLLLSPDGRRLAVVQDKPNVSGSYMFTMQGLVDVYLLGVPANPADLPVTDLENLDDRRAGWFDAANLRLTPAIVDLMTYYQQPTLSWSPDSRRLAYATVGSQATGDVFVLDAASRVTRNLTETFSLPPSTKTLGFGEQYVKYLDRSPRFGARLGPLWMPDGASLLVTARGELWSIPVEANIPLKTDAPPRLLTRDFPLETRRVLSAAGNPAVAALDEQGRLVLVAKARDTRTDSVWKFRPDSGESTRIASLAAWIDAGGMRADRQLRNLFFTGQAMTAAKNLSRLALDKQDATPRFITEFKRELEQREYPRSQVLSWKTSDGYMAHGLLYLPAGAAPLSPAPLVIRAYPGSMESLIDRRARTGARFYGDSDLENQLRDGIAVLFADIPLSDAGVYQEPMRQLVEGVNLSADAALATGLIDAKRMGIVGVGYGGYMVNAVITQTTRFKAAVSVLGVADWFGQYLGGRNGRFEAEQVGRMISPIWTEPQRYMDNSPIRYWDKVRTPVLFIRGQDEDEADFRQTGISFKGLRYQNRDAILAHYNNGGALGPEADRRIRGWFREHLLGARPITQLAEQGSFFFDADTSEDALLR